MVDIAIFSHQASGLKVTVPQRQKKAFTAFAVASCVHFCVNACVYSWSESARKIG